jgi:hypothetical protein
VTPIPSWKRLKIHFTKLLELVIMAWVFKGAGMGTIVYRTAAVLIALFAAGHTLGFRQADPKWNAETLLHTMRTLHFRTQGFERSYWDFYTGFGLFVSVFLVLAAVLAWQLGSIPVQQARSLQVTAWALAAAFVVTTIFSWRYFFWAPLLFCGVISILLIAGAWLASRAT